MPIAHPRGSALPGGACSSGFVTLLTVGRIVQNVKDKAWSALRKAPDYVGET